MPRPRAFYVDKVAEGVATIAAAFWPKPVIVRMSDFKSNEYRKLIGGSRYEPEEENPMLGFRGAARYICEDFGEAFEMECEALRRVRDDMGLTNVADHGALRAHPEAGRARDRPCWPTTGLKRGENDLQADHDVRSAFQRHPGRASSWSTSTASPSAPTT